MAEALEQRMGKKSFTSRIEQEFARIRFLDLDSYKEKKKRFLELFERVKQVEFENQTLKRFQTEDVIEKVERGGTIEVGGEVKKGVVFFTDLTNFTGISAKYRDKPENISEIVLNYFNVLDQIFHKYQIQIANFYGDATICYVLGDDAKERAVNAFKEIRWATRKLQEKGLPIKNTIGATETEFIVANVGNNERLETMLLGVGEATELEGAAKGEEIFLSKDIAEWLKENPIEGVNTKKKKEWYSLTIQENPNYKIDTTTILDAEKRAQKTRRIRREPKLEEKIDDLIKALRIKKIKGKDARTIVSENLTRFETKAERFVRKKKKENIEYRKRLSPAEAQRVKDLKIGEPSLGLYQHNATITFVYAPYDQYKEKIENLNLSVINEVNKGLIEPILTSTKAHNGEWEKLINFQPVMITHGKTSISRYHALDAADSALEIAAKIEGACIGINTGSVMAGSVGAPDREGKIGRQEHTVTSDTVNVSSRIAGVAKRVTDTSDIALGNGSKILIGPETYNRIKNDYEFGKVIEKTDIKGLEGQIIKLYPLLGVKKKKSPYEGELIGRKEEASRIEQILEKDHSVTQIWGGAGVGKSRFCFDMEAKAIEKGYKVLTGVCFERNQDVPYSLLGSLVGNIIGRDKVIEEGSGNNIVDKILFDKDVEVPRLTKEELEFELEVFTKDLIKKQTQNFILYLRDTHWADKGSKRILNTITENLKTLADGKKVHLWHATRNKEPIFDITHNVEIKPWDTKTEFAERYVDYIFERDVDVDRDFSEIKKAIVEVAEGNPYVIEQYVRYAIDNLDQGISAGELRNQLPEELKDAIGSRVDALSNDERELLQTLAILGPKYRTKTLQQIFEKAGGKNFKASLRGLERSNLVNRINETIIFNHARTHDVTYNISFKHGERKELHYTAGSYFEENDPMNLEALSYHFLESDMTETAVMQEAVDYTKRLALQRTKEKYLHEEAIKTLWTGIEKIQDISLEHKIAKAEMLVEIQKICMDMEIKDHIDKTIEEMETITAGIKETNEVKRFKLYSEVARGYELHRQRKFKDIIELYKDKEQKILETGDKDLLFYLINMRSLANYYVTENLLGKLEFDKAEEVAQKAIEELKQSKAAADSKEREAKWNLNLGRLHYAKAGSYWGRWRTSKHSDSTRAQLHLEKMEEEYKKAINSLENAEEIAKEFGLKVDLTRIYGALGGANYHLGNFDRSIEFYQGNISIAKKIKRVDNSVYFLLGNSLLEKGIKEKSPHNKFLDEAISRFEYFITQEEKRSSNMRLPSVAAANVHLGTIYAKRRDYTLAQPKFNEAYTIANKHGLRGILLALKRESQELPELDWQGMDLDNI